MPGSGKSTCGRAGRSISLNPWRSFLRFEAISLTQKKNTPTRPKISETLNSEAYEDENSGISHTLDSRRRTPCLKGGKVLAVLRCQLPQTVEQLVSLERHGDVVAVAEVARPHVGLREHCLYAQGPMRLTASTARNDGVEPYHTKNI